MIFTRIASALERIADAFESELASYKGMAETHQAALKTLLENQREAVGRMDAYIESMKRREQAVQMSEAFTSERIN